MRFAHFFFGGGILLVGLFAACSSVQEYLKTSIQKPRVEFTGAEINGLSFEALDLIFDLRIANPNPVGINLTGFDYNLFINRQSFVKGRQDDGLQIAANGENTVQIPLTLQFSEIYQSLVSLKNADSSQYKIACGFSFDLPVLGMQRIPVSKEGSIPLLKLPHISVESLQLKEMNFTGADLQLNLRLFNPNAFSFLVKALHYELEVNEKPWVHGQSEDRSSVAAKDAGLLAIPISLNFLQIGQSVSQLMKRNQTLNYHLKGDLNLGSSLPLLGEVKVLFDRSGQIRITR